MTDTPLTTLTTQAWSTYASVSGRTKDYLDLLATAYANFLGGAKTMDPLMGVLDGDAPPQKTIDAALSQISVMDGALGAIIETMTKFKSMDATAVNAAATLSQATVRANLNKSEDCDDTFVMNLNNVLYQCQMTVAGALAAR